MGLIFLTLTLYLLLLGFIAYRSYCKINNHNDFFIAGKAGSVLTVSGSLLATILGGSAVIGAIDAAPRLHWAISWFMICAAIGLLVIVPFASTINQLGRFTLPGLLESMHGKRSKKISSLIIPVAWTGIIAVQIIASAKILESFANISYGWGVVLSGVVFISYTLAGGQYSILKTDLAQSILVIIGLLTIAFFTFRYANTNQVEIPMGGSFFNPNFSVIDLLVLVLTYSTTFSTGPDIYTRLFCARDTRTIKKSLIISGLVLIPVALAIGYLGVSGSLLREGSGQGTILVNLSKMVLPSWGVALLVLALLSATLSSADTTLLSASVIVSDLVLKGNFNIKPVAKTRLIIVLIGTVSILVAWHFTSIIDLLLLALAVYAGAFTLPVFAGLLHIRFHPKFLSAAIVSGGIIALAGKFMSLVIKGNWGNYLLLVSFLVSGVILWWGRYTEEKT